MRQRKIRIGTRGSALALWQAEWAKSALIGKHSIADVEIVILKTKGDAIQDTPLSKLPGKAFFTKEIEDALLRYDVDLAVHSGKDMPTELPHGLILAGFSKRHPPMDVLVSTNGAGLMSLCKGARIGTSSVRRKALVLNLGLGFDVLDLRGNVDTRLKKLDSGLCDAIILAAAGIERLGFGHRITERLDPVIFPPAVSQGAMALEIREGDEEMKELVLPLIDEKATIELNAERALLKSLGGGCQVPMGALAVLNDQTLTIHASLIAPDGSARIDDRIEANINDAPSAGVKLGQSLLAKGGDKILKMVSTAQIPGKDPF